MTKCSLAIQGSYKTITLALFSDDTLIDSIQETSSRASSSLIPLIDQLMNRNNTSVHDLAFIACEQGPGAFTSLRVTLSTINGIGFASGVPLIGVDGLEALAYSGDNNAPEYFISLLNAYNNEVYYGIYHKDGNEWQPIESSYSTIEKFSELWVTRYTDKKAVVQGNGALLFKELIQKNLPAIAIAENLLETATIEAINKIALSKFLKKESGTKLAPLYLKEQTYAIKN